MRNILIRISVRHLRCAVLGAVVGIAFLAPVPTMAQDGCFIDKNVGARLCPVDGAATSAGSGKSSGEGTVGGIVGDVIGGVIGIFRESDEARTRRLKEAYEANEAGNQFYNNGDWARAIAAYEKAATKNPSDTTIKKNLDSARVANARALQAVSNARAVQAVANANAETERQNLRLAKEAAERLHQSVEKLAQSVVGATAASGVLDFDGGNAPASLSASELDFTADIAADAMVVDARNVPSGLRTAVAGAITGAYKDAPPGVSDRVRKGFQAIDTEDWKLARAWFQDALNRDPSNIGIQRLVALSDYTVTVPARITNTIQRKVPEHAAPMSQTDREAYLKILSSSEDAIRAQEFQERVNAFYLSYVPKHPELKLSVETLPAAATPVQKSEKTIDSYIKQFLDLIRPPDKKTKRTLVSAVRG